jgi:hypothetical protein
MAAEDHERDATEHWREAAAAASNTRIWVEEALWRDAVWNDDAAGAASDVFKDARARLYRLRQRG